MDSQQPYGREDLMKRIEEYLKEIDKRPKYNNIDNQQLNKSSEQDYIERLEFSISQLKYSSYILYKKVQKFPNLPKIKESYTVTNLDCSIINNKLLLCEEGIKTYLYNRDERLRCILNTQRSPCKIECTHYDNKRSIYSDQIISFKQIIKDTILDIFDISFPGILNKNLSKQDIVINSDFYMNWEEPKKENLKIIKDSNLVSYNYGNFRITITWY
jgi:hypothetical protein